MTVIDDRDKPKCDCCGGTGTHDHRPYITASPFDTDTECTACDGTGATWHAARRNSCLGYRNLRRAAR